jgi:tail tube protein
VSNLDTAVLAAKETTYATAVPPTRGYEAHADAFKLDQAQLDSVGFRAGIQALRKDRSRVVNMGGESTIEVDFLNQSMGPLLDAAVGATVGPTTVLTTGKQYVFTTTSAEPATSLTLQILKSKVDGGTDVYQHEGCVAKTFKLTQNVGELLVLSIDFDAATVNTAAAAGTPVYVDGAVPYAWIDSALTVNSVPTDANAFEFTIDHKLNTDRRYLRQSAQKKRPRRAGLPDLGATFSTPYEDNSLVTLRTLGTVVPISIVWQGGVIGAGTATFKVQLDLPACQFTAGDAEASMSDLSKTDFTVRVLDPGTGPAATLTVVTSDSAL